MFRMLLNSFLLLVESGVPWMKFSRTILRVSLRFLPMIVGLLAMVAVIAWMSGFFNSRLAPGQVEVRRRHLRQGRETDVVREVTKDYFEEAVGTLKSAARTLVASKVLARIEQITVSAGDEVHRGDILVELASGDLDARLHQAEEMLSAAEATRTEADTSLERARRLREESPNVISPERFDEIKARAEVARAESARSMQALTEAQVMISYATIRSPQDGRVVDRQAEPGDMAQPGQPLLVLYDANALRLEAPVAESLAVRLKSGDKLTVNLDAVDRSVDAVIDEIVPQAVAPSRSFLVKAAISGSPDLYEGMFGRMLIPIGPRRYLRLPQRAVQRIGQLEYVDVVDDDETIERRYIKTGREGSPGHVEVLSGLNAGDRVALN